MIVADLIRSEAGNDQVACITVSVDQTGHEANLSYGWTLGEDAADHVEAAGEVDATDEAAGEIELGGIDLDEALEVYAAAESSEPIGYVPTSTHRTHRCVTVERAAIGMRPGLRTTYIWPSGGW